MLIPHGPTPAPTAEIASADHDISDVIDHIRAAHTSGEALHRVGDALGLADQASQAVTARVLTDQKFATQLAAVRGFPDWRDRLPNDPMNDAFAPAEEASDDHNPRSAAALVAKGANALLRWGQAGSRRSSLGCWSSGALLARRAIDRPRRLSKWFIESPRPLKRPGSAHL